MALPRIKRHGGDAPYAGALFNTEREVADPIRLERTTSAFGGQRSIQLSYESVVILLAMFCPRRYPRSARSRSA
jgi:hypothetical protein